MSEATSGREPVQILEIRVPNCGNTYGVAPCTATGTGNLKCFNCRNTCDDPANYRDLPDAHLTPDLTLGDGGTIASGDLTRTADLFAGFEVRFGITPTGTIWEQGGSADQAAYLGITGGNLVFRAGDGTVADGVNVAKVEYSWASLAGKTVYLYVEIDTAAGSVTLWGFDPVELTLTQYGTDTASSGLPASWAGADGGAIGIDGGSNIATGEDGGDWNGKISVARFYDSTSAPDMTVSFSRSIYLGYGDQGEPDDDVRIYPCLTDVSTIGTRINLSGSQDDYKALGRRATLDFSATDFADDDEGQDDYLSDRTYNPLEQSTFWKKWIYRNKFGKVGALVRVYEGYTDQALSEMLMRTYVLDRINREMDQIGGHCRDVLSRTEFRKTQVPAPSNGKLAQDLATATTTFFYLVGDVTADYPASGTVRINDETITYSTRTYDAVDNETDFTITARGSDGSTADDHSTGDLVQICRRYTNARIDDVITEWLGDDAGIEGQLLNLAGFTSETDAYLTAYNITTLITEPTGVDELLGRLSQECSFYVWWDERSQIVDMAAIRPINRDSIRLTEENNVLRDTLRVTERPKERLNIVTFYYNPRNFSGDLEKPANFFNSLLVVNGTTSARSQYGNVVQTREIFSRFLTTEAEANQTSSRLSRRYADVPTEIEFYLDAKDRSLWVGDFVAISHREFVLETGELDMGRRWLIIEAEEVDPGNLVRYVASDITLDGLIYIITENGIGTYDPDLFDQGNAYITDNNGLNPNGTTGATIS